VVKNKIQRQSMRCACGRIIEVTRQSDWDFEADCAGCGRAYAISWRHHDDPPRWITDGERGPGGEAA